MNTKIDAKAIVAAQNTKYMEAYEEDNVEGVMSLYSNDSIIVPPNGPNATGINAIKERLSPVILAVGRLSLETVDAKAIDDDHIIEHTRMHVYKKSGELLSQGKTMVLWRKENGDWKMHWDTWNVEA